MNGVKERILFNITVFPGDDEYANEMADATYFRLNNILSGSEQFVNVLQICTKLNESNKILSDYIHNRCSALVKKNTVFSPEDKKINLMFNNVADSRRKNIRILLYPGAREDILKLKMNEATHNMIIQFKEDSAYFVPTEAHNNPPSFYQICLSEDIAILHSEALLVDSCMCHYLGVSDVAYHHDDKQKISADKVQFILECSKDESFLKTFSKDGCNLIKYVASKLKTDTPYISFLSIFTVAPYDIVKNFDSDVFAFFEDYCNLWKKFQEWYFKENGRVFYKEKEIVNPLEKVFDRNIYQGQISPSRIKVEIEKEILNPPQFIDDMPFGKEERFAIVLIKHIPDDAHSIAQLKALFSGELYPAKWDIVYWGEIHKYYDSGFDFEIVPFIIKL